MTIVSGYGLKRYFYCLQTRTLRDKDEENPMSSAKIAVIAGDGIGKEVVPEGLKVLEATARVFGLDLAWDHLDWGCDHHARFGRMMPENGTESRYLPIG